MITSVKIENFKKFLSADFMISQPISLFVGQNNGGKTTALQAISLWSFLIMQWKQKKGGGSAKERTGAPVTRAEIHPAPVLEITNLWTEGQVRKKMRGSENIKLRITLRGVNEGTRKPWEYGVEATFGNKELLYANPIDVNAEMPDEVGKIFHLPPLSGVQTEEPKIDPGAQLRAIGEGRPGEILRNLLLDLYDHHPEKWEKLIKASKEFFAIDVLPIQYNPVTDPHISVFYQSVAPRSKQQYKMEISNAGSGFLQFLLIASFLLAHDNAILLIDEPDSHMHVFLQRSIFEWLQKIAVEEKAQVLISTHSEVLINSSGIEHLITFFGSNPKLLKSKNHQLVAALSEVSPLAIIHAEWKRKIIYVEGETDRKLLVAWAEALDHPVKSFLLEAFFYPLGTNGIGKAKKHFSAIRSVISGEVRGFVLRDGNVTKTEGNVPGLICEYWKLSEIENYLLDPETLMGFVENFGFGGLFGVPKREEAREYLTKHLSPAYFSDPHNNTQDLGRKKGSDFLSEFFDGIKISLGKSDYWKIAQTMSSDRIFPGVKEMLDALKLFLG